MKTPPFMLGCALLFWGWQTQMLWLAIPAAAVLELSKWVSWRLEVDHDHFCRLWNLSFLLVLGLGLFLFIAEGGYTALNEAVTGDKPGLRTESLKNVGSMVLRFFQLLPATMLLFLAVYAYGPFTKLPASTFSFIYRRRARRNRSANSKEGLGDILINPVHAFLLILLVGVSASNAHPAWFFPALVTLIGWLFWYHRPAGHRKVVWVGTLGLAIIVGFSSQVALVFLQGKLEAWQNLFMQGLGNAKSFDTSQTTTSMGTIGQLKQSGHIIWRVESGKTNPPGLLLEGAYNIYQQSWRTNSKGLFDPPTWTTVMRSFKNTQDGRRSSSWVLDSGTNPGAAITLIGYTERGESHIPHPLGLTRVDDKTASILAVQTNGMGAARSLGGQMLAIFDLWHEDGRNFAMPPYEDDTNVWDGLMLADQRALREVSAKLELDKLPTKAALAKIQLFFFNNFNYTLNLRAPLTSATNNTPLSNFLLERREGHCEFFATATTLLLRAAGIPARYAVGFAVQEKRSNEQFVIRDRHAHAWSLAWVDGRWIEVDNTPAGWFEAEWRDASPWEAQLDWWSDAWMAFHRWRTGDSQFRQYVLIAGVLALVYLGWRQIAGKSWRNARSAQTGRVVERHGLDSEFFDIVRELARDRPREPAETLGDWLKRQTFADAALAHGLGELLDLHYRLRFDPAGLSPAERSRLRSGSAEWLRRFARR